MNQTTHTQSVVALLLIVGCALIGFPVSVFSQTSTEESTSTEAVLTENLPTVSTTSAVSNTPEAAVGTYPIEKLLSTDVFNDFVVGPGRFALELAPGESKTVEMIVSNRMGEKKRFSFGIEDMQGSQDTSQAIVLLGSEKGPYTIRDYITVPHMQFELEHAELARIPVTISLPPDAEPGGFYGSLLVSIVSDPVDLDENENAKPGSVVVSRIGTLFFVTTPGTTEHDGILQKFETSGGKKILTSGPVSFGLVTENKGTVHLNPYGEIRLYNTLGNEVGFMELQPWFVMPKSLRLREVSWDREFLIGRYTAVAKISRGYDNIVDEKSYTFWVIPLQLIAAVFVGFFVLFLLLRFVLSRFEFKRKSR